MPERKIIYESLKHKADGGFLIRAPSLERLFIDAALSMVDQQVSLDRIQDTKKQVLKIEATTKELLMVRWLEQIQGLMEKNQYLPKRIVFNKFDGKKIEATLFGDSYEALRHGTLSTIKTISCQQLQLEENQNGEMHFFAKIQLQTA